MSSIVSLVFGSQSDFSVMRWASSVLDDFSVPYEMGVVSAHRTPERLFSYASELKGRGIRLVIAGAGGAAHLPGMLASLTTLPVLGVPIPGAVLSGADSLYSIVQMPRGVPVACFALGKAGAVNAALFAVSVLGLSDAVLHEKWEKWRIQQTDSVSFHVVHENEDA